VFPPESAAAFFASAKSLASFEVKNGDSAGRLPVDSYWLVSFFVSILLASTSGWLNALMPMIEPATAVAISQRKNSWPSVYTFGSVIRITG